MENNSLIVDSPLGNVRPDTRGAAIGACRIDPDRSYIGIPLLLQAVINENSDSAWNRIVSHIDYTYEGVSIAMEALKKETGFAETIQTRVNNGQNLLFKPNLVSPSDIDPMTHGPGNTVTCTPWPFIAALMRWFHDHLDITYHQMSLGEGATATSAMAASFTKMQNASGVKTQKGKRVITTQAVMEGKSGDFYGGWGFYFARKYLVDTHDPTHTDDPMTGYEESVSGQCLAPGNARDKLLVYDINLIDDDRSNGREIPVPGGVNFETVILHKAIIGGDPNDAEDRKAYPGCVLINVPKLKAHILELITNAVKNLGVGLYPMELNVSKEPGKVKWLYATPDKPIPGMKDKLPHTIWQPEIDETTGLHKTDGNGDVVWRKTGGMPATMADVVSAVGAQDIYMLHVTDAIQATNGNQAGPTTFGVSEGLILTSEDPLALDLLAARYLFSNVPMADARDIHRQQQLPDHFFRKVPIPRYDGHSIVTEEGYDSPIWLYTAFPYCRDRDIGQFDYFVTGKDIWQDADLATVEQQLGRIEDDMFTELMTDELYYATPKPVYDLQATSLAYIRATDEIDGTNRLQALFDMYDENRDGIIDYTERGRFGGPGYAGEMTRMNAVASHPMDLMKLQFVMGISMFRFLKREWNMAGRDANGIGQINGVVLMAMRLSQLAEEKPDPLTPGLTYGDGKWPSFRYVEHLLLRNGIYGPMFPDRIPWMTPYGFAFCYADYRWGEGRFTGGGRPNFERNIIGEYHNSLTNGSEPLPFTIYLPEGYGMMKEQPIPNVEETDNPSVLFSASFNNGGEIWRDLSPSDFP